ncbi:MAG: sugar ABC transporter substrate-binding protein [Desulfovibrio sp.]|jgi:ABC-type sugar transport system substrate-binding protein|nr:sugar ABC transporter substrate-binding protein [Desulfovibrio sp.]
MKRSVTLLTTVFLLLGMLCLGQASQSHAAGAEKQYKFVFIVKSMQFPFFLNMIDGAEEAVKLLPGVSLKCVGPETPYSVEEQMQLMEQAITDGVDAILIAPADSKAIVPAVEKANKAGILVATPNTKAYGGNILTWTGVDNYQVGYELGTALCNAVNGKGNVLLIEGTPGNSTSEERVEGYKDAFKKFPDIKLLDSQPANFNREKGMQLMENWLQKYKKIDAVGSINKDMTMGAVEAAKLAGRDKEMVHITFDVDNDALEALENGSILLTGAQNERSQIALAMSACYLALNGYKVPPVQYLPLSLVYKKDVPLYRGKN